MTKISKSVQIDAPPERVFAFMTSPSNLPEVWPSLVEVSNVQRKPDGTHSFDWVYKMAGVRFKGHAQTTDVEKDKRVVVKNEKGIPSTFRYDYEQLAGNRTKITMHVDYTIPNQLLNKLVEPVLRRINEHEAQTLLDNLKARMELAKEARRPEARA